jgi:hypothetical protein
MEGIPKGTWYFAECQTLENNRRIFLPHRPQHTIPPQDAEDRPKYRKICKECEMRLREAEATAQGKACTVSMEDIEMEIIGKNYSNATRATCWGYTRSVEYVKIMKLRHPEVFSKAREAMDKIEHVRDSIRQLSAEAKVAEQEGGRRASPGAYRPDARAGGGGGGNIVWRFRGPQEPRRRASL